MVNRGAVQDGEDASPAGVRSAIGEIVHVAGSSHSDAATAAGSGVCFRTNEKNVRLSQMWQVGIAREEARPIPDALGGRQWPTT
jgi:hypothetical protein